MHHKNEALLLLENEVNNSLAKQNKRKTIFSEIIGQERMFVSNKVTMYIIYLNKKLFVKNIIINKSNV